MEHSEKNIVILGCGWLGQIVGKALVEKGASVSGSYRRNEVKETLEILEITGFYLDFDGNLALPKNRMEQATHVLVFIPPSASRTREYASLLTELVEQFPQNAKVIFSSSTGIYPQEAGTYTETFKAFDTHEKGPNRLLSAETALKSLLGKRLTTLRLAGLIGPKRHPAYSLSGKTLSDDGSNPVNLIHAMDIVEAVSYFLTHDTFGVTYNLVSPSHPTKKDYYTRAANYLGIPPANYGKEIAVNRLVSGNGIVQDTSFEYLHALDNFDDFIR